MPSIPEPSGHWSAAPLGVLLGTGLVAALVYALVTHPVGTLAAAVVLTALGTLSHRRWTRQFAVLAEQRASEDIGSFARAFNRRSGDPLDPWAIRAVWNALVTLTEEEGGHQIPLRPTDRFEDVGIDWDDVDELIEPLVEQCERKPGNWTANPYNGKVSTIGALVHFISAQPLRYQAIDRLLPNDR